VEFANRRLEPSWRWRLAISILLGDVGIAAFAWIAYERIAWGPLIGLCIAVPLGLFAIVQYRRARTVNQPLAQTHDRGRPADS
jgi:uncharacterized membrane protein HdeD (DUF308 family)